MTANFEDFWRVYPRKVGKRSAEQAWARAVRRAYPSTIMEGLRRYERDPERIRKGSEFTVHPTTWLNQDRWLDDLSGSPSVPVVDLEARWDGVPEGITFDMWLRDHASPEEVEKARLFGVGKTLEAAS